ncbi:hypothetical protein SKAU_G00143240 [Synaphobranchus kaupii]|uniref:Uncharacterized protein n=1 Tax=Synaphobranchus kaupii TaxID=118154 RepID=A0A9Q1J4G7_SYNKA|nr:hypothetical protein SKAU_G00143240 [Synaphobranchus kaupii]
MASGAKLRVDRCPRAETSGAAGTSWHARPPFTALATARLPRSAEKVRARDRGSGPQSDEASKASPSLLLIPGTPNGVRSYYVNQRIPDAHEQHGKSSPVPRAEVSRCEEKTSPDRRAV